MSEHLARGLRRAALLACAVLATGCWRSTGDPVVPADRPTPAAGPSATKRALASQLADTLRDPGDDMVLAQYIDRQLVVLDVELRTLDVLCDAQTLGAAIRLSQLINDPDRRGLDCNAERAGITCVQIGSPVSVVLHFRHGAPPVLVGAVISGTPRLAGPLGADYRSKRDASTCPP